MKLVLFAGTTEGRQLATALDRPDLDVTACVATDYGRELLDPLTRVKTHTGRLDAAGMAGLLRGADAVIDATHPYAQEASQNIAQAAKAAGVRLLHLARAASRLDGTLTLPDAAAAAERLKTLPGNVLLTTGAKELPAFAGLPGQRLFARVLPSAEGLAACEAAGIPRSHIIAMQGPFDVPLNEAMMHHFAIDILVTKDGGAAGGFLEKKTAAEHVGATVLVISRPPQTPGLTQKELLKELGL